MGGGSKTETVHEVTKTDPWAPQQPYILEAFNEAQSVYNANKAAPKYTGEFVAQPTDAQAAQPINALNWSMNEGQSAVNQGLGLSTAAAGMGLGGTAGAMGALYGMGTSDRTAANIEAAGRYANSPYADGMVQAANRDVARGLSEVQLPGIDRAAALSGNLNSSRAGVASAMATRDAADRMADTSAAIRGQLYSQGLTSAQADNALKAQALTSAGGLAGNLYSTGLGGIDSAVTNAQTNLGTGLVASGQITANNQAAIDNAMSKAQYAESQPWTQLANFYNIVGNKSWGGTQTTDGTRTTRENPSALSTIGSIVGVVGSLFRCDVRTKENITFTGIEWLGFPVYEFSYIGSTDRVINIMAQDVEAMRPDCVHDIEGIKHIDLLKLALTSEEAH